MLEETSEGLQFIKKKFQHSRFPVNIAKVLRTHFWRTSANGCFGRGTLVQNIVNTFTCGIH